MLHGEIVNVTISSGTSTGTTTHTVQRRLDDATPVLLCAYAVNIPTESLTDAYIRKRDWESTRKVNFLHGTTERILINAQCNENDIIDISVSTASNVSADRTIKVLLLFSYGNAVQVPVGELESRYVASGSQTISNLLPNYDYYPIAVAGVRTSGAKNDYVTLQGTNSKGMTIVAPSKIVDNSDDREVYYLPDTHCISGRETITCYSALHSYVVYFVRVPSTGAGAGAGAGAVAYRPNLGLLGMLGGMGGATPWRRDTRM